MTQYAADLRVTENEGLVYMCAKRFLGRGAEYDDLVQAGRLGLVKASLRFDESRGNKFSTFAVPYIMGEIKQLFALGQPIRLSRGAAAKAARINEVRETIILQTGIEPSASQIATACGLSLEEVGVLTSVKSVDSIDRCFEMCEVATEESQQDIDEIISLKTLIKGLEKRDRLLLYYRYCRSMSQETTAEKLKLSQSQVSKSERRIIGYLKQNLKCQLL